MYRSRMSIAILALACVGLLASCNSSPSSPDIEAMPPGTSALPGGQGGTLTSGENFNNRGDGALGTVYVTSQGLYYDTFVSAQQLPPHGPFQLLVQGETEFGPGDKGYVGGRWKIPNGDGTFTYLLCPLLGPGRENP